MNVPEHSLLFDNSYARWYQDIYILHNYTYFTFISHVWTYYPCIYRAADMLEQHVSEQRHLPWSKWLFCLRMSIWLYWRCLSTWSRYVWLYNSDYISVVCLYVQCVADNTTDVWCDWQNTCPYVCMCKITICLGCWAVCVRYEWGYTWAVCLHVQDMTGYTVACVSYDWLCLYV